MTRKRFQRRRDDFKRLMEELDLVMDLDAHIRLVMHVERIDGDNSASKPTITDHLSLKLLETAKYKVRGQKEVEIINNSGIMVPKNSGTLAAVQLYTRDQISPDEMRYHAFRIDPQKGEVYAQRGEIVDAWDSLMSYVKMFEKHHINIKEICPDAQTDLDKRGVIVSVQDIGPYFNEFQQSEVLMIPRHYNTATRRINGPNEPVFLEPEAAQLLTLSLETLASTGSQ